MARDENSDILEAILSGGISGMSENLKNEVEMKKEMFKENFKNIITRRNQEASMPDWARTGTPPAGTNIRQTVKTPYGSMSLIPTAEQDPIKAEKAKLEVDMLKQKQDQNIRKQEVAKTTELNRIESIKSKVDDLRSTIKEIKKNNRLDYFGKSTSLLPAFAEQKEKVAWETNLNKLLSGKILDLMGDLKAQSRTGATGFGALSGPELMVLVNASTALKKKTSKEDAVAILNDMDSKLSKISSSTTSSGNNKTGGVLHIDANGNKAMVFPDGSFKEVQ